LLPPVAVFQDALGGVGRVQVGAFHELPDAVQLPRDLCHLGLDGFQVPPLLPCRPVHLLVRQLRVREGLDHVVQPPWHGVQVQALVEAAAGLAQAPQSFPRGLNLPARLV
jgi:hypothetical protein